MPLPVLLSIVFLAAFGLYFGRIVARHSIKARPIYGGPVAQAFHYAACVVMTAVVPSIFVEVFVLRLGSPLILGVAAIVVIFACLFAYALVEEPARRQAQAREDRGWTADDARTSGL